jgi:hypothetical protein
MHETLGGREGEREEGRKEGRKEGNAYMYKMHHSGHFKKICHTQFDNLKLHLYFTLNNHFSTAFITGISKNAYAFSYFGQFK